MAQWSNDPACLGGGSRSIPGPGTSKKRTPKKKSPYLGPQEKIISGGLFLFVLIILQYGEKLGLADLISQSQIDFRLEFKTF